MSSKACVLLLLLLCLGAVNPAPLWSWFSSEEEAKLSPIVFIPGKGGSQIEVKIERGEDDDTGCPKSEGWSRIWLDVWQFLWPGYIDCWAANMKLHYDPDTHETSATTGAEFRVPGFGETYSVEYVDDSWMAYMMYNIGGYFFNTMTHLESWGYIRSENVHGAPYDFRFAPHSQRQYFRKLKELIEDTYRRNYKTKVTLLAHSMGGIQTQYFLHTMSQRWKDKFINAFVPVNTPWKGTVLISNLYTSGYNWGIAPLEQDVVKSLQRTWETGVLLLPQDEAWEEGHVIVETPERNYTAHDYDDYFRDVDYPLGKQLYDNIQHESYDMGNPGVDVYCVYSHGMDTPASLVYDEGEFPHGNPHMTYGDGDGTVNLRSLEYCKTWMVQNDNPDHVADVKTFEGVSHMELLYHQDFMDVFKEIVEL